LAGLQVASAGELACKKRAGLQDWWLSKSHSNHSDDGKWRRRAHFGRETTSAIRESNVPDGASKGCARCGLCADNSGEIEFEA
jgi:hypothetical protein